MPDTARTPIPEHVHNAHSAYSNAFQAHPSDATAGDAERARWAYADALRAAVPGWSFGQIDDVLRDDAQTGEVHPPEVYVEALAVPGVPRHAHLIDRLNLEHWRERLPVDQREDLAPPMYTWAIGGGAAPLGRMTLFHTDRVAVFNGADSFWGDWHDGLIALDDGDTVIDAEGNEVQ